MTPTLLTDDAVGAWRALGQVLAASYRGLRRVRSTPTRSPPTARPNGREAAAACVTACPALEACARYANSAREVWLVWAGVDRTPTTRKRSKTEAAA